MKPDERYFLDELQKRTKNGEHPYVREVVAEIGLNPNRAAYICEKWSHRGWYDYGVNVLAGWLNEEGMKA